MGYVIVVVSGILRETIDKNGDCNKYGEPKIFETAEKAQKWIDKRTYKGMSYHYEIKEV